MAPVVIACLLAGLSVVVLPRCDLPSWRETVSPRLPTPGGPDAVGLRRTILPTGADDPWSPGRERVLMVDIRYPATAGEHPLRHYLLAQHMSELAMLAWAPAHERRLGLAEHEVNWQFITHSYEWAPPRAGRFPVVVISTPAGVMRTSLTALAEDLASHGLVVVTLDHPFDTPVVELWPTREVLQAHDADRRLTDAAARGVRAHDLAAVADHLGELDDDVAKVMAPDCVLTISGDGLTTDEPMIEAQLQSRITRTIDASPSHAARAFREGSADLRDTVTSLLHRRPGCAGQA